MLSTATRGSERVAKVSRRPGVRLNCPRFNRGVEIKYIFIKTAKHQHRNKHTQKEGNLNT